MKLKILKPKPLSLKYKWQRQLNLYRLAIEITMMSFLITLYVINLYSQDKINEQDRKISEMYGKYIQVVNLLSESEKKIENLRLRVYQFETGHLKIKKKWGFIYKHGCVEVEK